MPSRATATATRKTSRALHFAVGLTTLACVGAAWGSNLDTIGLTQLLSLDPTLTGAGVAVGQVEADAAGPNGFEVNPAKVGQPASLFTYTNDSGTFSTTFNPAGESSHADNVGDAFYGTAGAGVAPGVAEVDNYSANFFSNSIIANDTMIPDAVVNQSFIFNENSTTPLTVADQQSIDTAYDNYIASYQTIFVSGAGNAGYYPRVNAPATSYNGIGVGAWPGPSSSGPTIDNGRSKPDITAPGTATSFTTPLVSGSAAILVQAGRRGDGGNSPDLEAEAVDPRTVKALLLNGASKQTVPFSRSPIAPLDPSTGAGMLNVYNSYLQLVGGQYSPSDVLDTVGLGGWHAPISGPVINATAGWDYETLTSSPTSNEYANYVFKPTSNTLTATLVWERQFNSTPNTPLGINDLCLYLYNETTGRLEDWSTSTVDNVQDVYDTNLNTSDVYDLEVLKTGGTAGVTSGVVSNNEDYALAFDFSTASSGTLQPGTWNVSGGGSWNATANWVNGIVPQAAQATVNLTNALSAASVVTLDGNQTVGHLNFYSSNSYTVAPGNGGVLTMDNGGATATATIVNSGGTHTISAPVNLASPTLLTLVNSGDGVNFSGNISGIGGLTVAGKGTVTLSGIDTYTGPTAVTGGTLVVGAAGALPGTTNLTIGNGTTSASVAFARGAGANTISSLAMSSGSTLDLSNNSLAINYGSGAAPEAAVRADLLSGYNDGLWNGPGITSSAAAGSAGRYGLGYADGSVDIGTPALPGQVLIKYTLEGDANLDGVVNLTDLLALLNNEGQTGRDWAEGDFNYDGTVNISDLLLLINNLGQSSAAITSFNSTIAIPEPATASLLAIGGAGLLFRRRKTTPSRSDAQAARSAHIHIV